MSLATGRIRTVLGDIEPKALGVCDAHDHLFLSSPAIPGRALDDPAAALLEAQAFHDAGGRALVQWTPAGAGRRARELADIAARTGLHLVAATGRHRRRFYESPTASTPAWPATLDRDDLARLFVEELTTGIDAHGIDGRTTVRAGAIKVAAGYHAIDDHEDHGLAAAADAHRHTGAPICVHLELGTHALAVIDLLERRGVPADRVILGHLARNPDTRLHREVAGRGAWLALDGPSRATHATDWRLLDVIESLVDAGHVGRLLLGADTVSAEARAATGGGPGSAALLTATAATVRRALGDRVARALLVDNPARAYAWS